LSSGFALVHCDIRFSVVALSLYGAVRLVRRFVVLCGRWVGLCGCEWLWGGAGRCGGGAGRCGAYTVPIRTCTPLGGISTNAHALSGANAPGSNRRRAVRPELSVSDVNYNYYALKDEERGVFSV